MEPRESSAQRATRLARPRPHYGVSGDGAYVIDAEGGHFRIEYPVGLAEYGQADGRIVERPDTSSLDDDTVLWMAHDAMLDAHGAL